MDRTESEARTTLIFLAITRIRRLALNTADTKDIIATAQLSMARPLGRVDALGANALHDMGTKNMTAACHIVSRNQHRMTTQRNCRWCGVSYVSNHH